VQPREYLARWQQAATLHRCGLARNSLSCVGMALVRILVDGFSLLHSWPALAKGKPRHSAPAREELVHRLTHYQDASGTPITVVFDGAGSRAEVEDAPSDAGVEILYSHPGQTADQMIERAAFRLKSYGEVMVVTDDFAEQDTVASFGAIVSSCKNFIGMVDEHLADLQRDLQNYNRKEQTKFRTS
jgi:YD repeat-containing protein